MNFKRAALFFCLILLIFPDALKGQASGKIVYKSILESQEFKELEGVLLFELDKSLFFFEQLTNPLTEDTKDSLKYTGETSIELKLNFPSPSLTSYHQVLIDRKAGEISSSEQYFKSGKMYDCITIEPSEIFNWVIHNETKKIGDFNAQMATTSFRGRDYTAWFTNKIPISMGPWKFHGLPGLIVEIYDNENGVYFVLSSVKIPFPVDSLKLSNNKAKRISIDEYAEYVENLGDEIKNMILSKLPRGSGYSDVSVSTLSKRIEREY